MKLRAMLLSVVAVCAVTFALAAPAMAQSPAENAYGGEGTNHVVTSTLPFTGINAGLVAVIGLGLAGAGFAARRAIRTQ